MIKEGIEMNAQMIESKIKEAAGQDLWEQGRFTLRITEKRSRVSTWKSTPMGMFVISVGYGDARTAVHTKKDGAFDVDRVITLLRHEEQRRLARAEREKNQSSNIKIAERVAEVAVSKGIARYISNYGKIDTTPTVVASQNTEGKVAVGFGLNNLTEAQATRALELFAAMKKELEAYVA